MIIYQSDKHTISTDGRQACKSSGEQTMHMPFYPERDASALAGEVDEMTAWRLLANMAEPPAQLSSSSPTPTIQPDHIFINGEDFVASPWSSSHDAQFEAPDGYDPVWALGASVFYLVLGCHVFQGLGGKGQTPSAPIPYLRRDMPELSDLISRCLSFDPKKRPAMEEILEIARRNFNRCASTAPSCPSLKKKENTIATADELDTAWPEDFI